MRKRERRYVMMIRIIPCLDVRNGRVVKGIQFQNLRDAGSPVELAREYEKQGADELVLLDVAATPEGRKAQRETIERVREVLSIPLTVGGGVRAIDDVEALLEAGADKVSVNTAAVNDPQLLQRMSENFGRQCTVLAIDAACTDVCTSKPRWSVTTHSGTTRHDLDAVAWATRGVKLGAGEILLTSWDRDGTRSGYDTELIEHIRATVDVPIIASGGAATAKHLADAVRAGADAVLAASIFHDGEYTVTDIKQRLSELNMEVRA
jgi:imidazole glycerol-phosphate synthase subunit HisF